MKRIRGDSHNGNGFRCRLEYTVIGISLLTVLIERHTTASVEKVSTCVFQKIKKWSRTVIILYTKASDCIKQYNHLCADS